MSRQPTQEERVKLIAEANELHGQGMPCSEIADYMGWGSSTVRRWVDPNYLAKYKQYKSDHKDELREKNAEYRDRTREEYNSRSRQWCKDHPGYYYEHGKKWKEDNREYATKRDRDYYMRNKDRITAYNKLYRSEHRNQYLEHARMRKAKIRGYDRIKDEDYESILMGQNGLCAYCGKKMLTDGDSRSPDYCTMDHIYPLSRGGVHKIENIIFACRSCNSSKNTKLISEWRPDLVAIMGNGVCGQENESVERAVLTQEITYLLREVIRKWDS